MTGQGSRSDPPAVAATVVGTPIPGSVQGTARPQRSLASGTRIKHYELIRELGRGGMGVVFAARDLRLGRRVAIKILGNADREVAERFLVEARATAQCDHENIVIIYEVDEHEGMPYMTLELLEGQTLRELLGPFGASKQLPPPRVIELALQIARALSRAHEREIIHRDLKPENVFLTANGLIKVLDFGIAKAMGSKDRASGPELAQRFSNPQLTRDGALVGTLPYMSPEQFGAGDVDRRADLWAFGIMMFEMLAGRLPVHPFEPQAHITATVIDQPLPSLGEIVAGLPEPLVELVDRCLRKHKADRYQTADELVRDLQRLAPERRARDRDADECPFVGLAAFQERDADRFFGRSREIARMATRVRELPLTAVIGPSGVGKSSFVRAGVGPALKQSGEAWDVMVMRPGKHPLAALAGMLEQRTTTRPITQPGLFAHHVQRLATEPGYAGLVLRERAHERDTRLLVFVDQYEELYTLGASPDERRTFIAALSGIADDVAGPLRVVISMRADFLDRVADETSFADEISRGVVFLGPPDRLGLRDALVQPLELAGYRFESNAIVGDMLDALGATPGALPLLQFAAAKLWDLRDRGTKQVTMASYHAIGGITGAIASHADDVIGALGARTRELAERVFRRLVTPDRTRAVVELGDLYELSAERGEIERVLDQLVTARLVVVQTQGNAAGTAELVHESLIARWPTLQRWLDEDREDAGFVAEVAAAAKQWDGKGRPNGMLWRGDALDEARRWYTLRPRELLPRDRDFLEQGFAVARRSKRARRTVVIGVMVALGGIAAAASFGLVQVRAAERRATEGEAKAHEEATRTKQALEERLAAEQAKQVAEQHEREAAEAAKAALAEQAVAEDTAKEKSAEVALTREQLEQALKEARAANVKAVAASAAANRAADDANRANAELATKLAREKAHVKELEDGKKKLATQLKE